jgi:trehalose synthase
MLEKVRIRHKIKKQDFLKFLTAKQKKELLRLAEPLKGKKVLHVNATSSGGGVAEILFSLVPYLRALGLKTDWYTISPQAGKKFFDFTNRLHNALQGTSDNFTKADWELYEKVNKKIASDLSKLNYDILVINDPQPLFSINYLNDGKPKMYRNHIDTSAPYKTVWHKVLPAILKYDFITFSNRDFVNNTLPKHKLRVFTPAIDPLALKQKIVSSRKARKYLKRFGIPEKPPLIVQVSRFDVWKNPLGVIEAFRLAQHAFPEMQLALVGFQEAKDNPHADAVHQDVEMIAREDPNIFVFFHTHHHKNLKSIPEFTMMVQNAADIVIQNSIKEGWGFTVAEAMWKEKVVIGGPASGIKKQITDGKNGFITKNSSALASQIIDLLKHPKKRKRIGQAGKKSVAKKFLFPRLVSDHLKVYKSVLK